MDRDQFLDWGEQMLAVQLGLPQVVRQPNNVQYGFSDPAIPLVRGPADGVGIGVVANVQGLEVRVHLFTYDPGIRAAWQGAGPVFVNAPYALPLSFRIGPGGNAAYLEFAAPVAGAGDFARWCAPVLGYVAFFVMARAQGIAP
ncbi:MAG: hypothetical protein KC464_35305 [Myxococcales bacterium]|nr:hypothetical protein [Myxococcales bacterium]